MNAFGGFVYIQIEGGKRKEHAKELDNRLLLSPNVIANWTLKTCSQKSNFTVIITYSSIVRQTYFIKKHPLFGGI